jgi:hypothetical protein
MFDNMFNGVMGKIKPGCCRLGMNGRIAIKTSDGYKTYDKKSGNVTNCSSFVLDASDDFFMVIPTRKLREGDIVLINGKPMYILEVKAKNRVEAMDYETSTIQTVIPERHAIMGRRFYGKIVSLLGSGFGAGKGGFFKNMLKLKMMSSMMGGSNGNAVDGMLGGNGLAMMMLMGNGSMDGLFDGFMDDDDDDGNDDEDSSIFDKLASNEDDEDEDDEEPPVKKAVKKMVKKTVKKTAKKNK